MIQIPVAGLFFAIAIPAVLVLINLLLIRRLVRERRAGLTLMEIVISVMEAGDPNLDGHSLHVHKLVELFYDYLPLNCQQKIPFRSLQQASLLFDMGKLGVPRQVLTRSGKLTKEEVALIRRHPENCVRILNSVDGFSRISDWILYHHERMDGRGYHGLKGEEIPLASRIIAVADTYSALTMDRTYKATMDHDEALIELRQAAGSQLDEKLVACFCEIPKHRVEECRDEVIRRMESYQDEELQKS